MTNEQLTEWAARYQAAWNSEQGEDFVACCTDEVSYRDADSSGEVRGRDAVRQVCADLFSRWKMKFEVDYALALRDVPGFLVGWKASMKRRDGDQSVPLSGVDVVFVNGRGISRVESHYDRVALAG